MKRTTNKSKTAYPERLDTFTRIDGATNHKGLLYPLYLILWRMSSPAMKGLETMEKYDALKMLHMVKHSYLPKEAELEALRELYRLLKPWSGGSDALVIVLVYNAGKIIGKREERNRRRIRKGGEGK